MMDYQRRFANVASARLVRVLGDRVSLRLDSDVIETKAVINAPERDIGGDYAVQSHDTTVTCNKHDVQPVVDRLQAVESGASTAMPSMLIDGIWYKLRKWEDERDGLVTLYKGQKV